MPIPVVIPGVARVRVVEVEQIVTVDESRSPRGDPA